MPLYTRWGCTRHERWVILSRSEGFFIRIGWYNDSVNRGRVEVERVGELGVMISQSKFTSSIVDVQFSNSPKEVIANEHLKGFLCSCFGSLWDKEHVGVSITSYAQ